jgi:hypothetical protein
LSSPQRCTSAAKWAVYYAVRRNSPGVLTAPHHTTSGNELAGNHRPPTLIVYPSFFKNTFPSHLAISP